MTHVKRRTVVRFRNGTFPEASANSFEIDGEKPRQVEVPRSAHDLDADDAFFLPNIKNDVSGNARVDDALRAWVKTKVKEIGPLVILDLHISSSPLTVENIDGHYHGGIRFHNIIDLHGLP